MDEPVIIHHDNCIHIKYPKKYVPIFQAVPRKKPEPECASEEDWFTLLEEEESPGIENKASPDTEKDEKEKASEMERFIEKLDDEDETDPYDYLHFDPPEEPSLWLPDIVVFCPWCRKKAGKITDDELIRKIYGYDWMPVPEEIFCRTCGMPIQVEPKNREKIDDMIKSDTRRWTEAFLFDEKDSFSKSSAVVVLNYSATGVNPESEKMFNKHGAIRLIMNMKSGMTYLKNGKIRGRYPEKYMRVIESSYPVNITYGSDCLRNLYGRGLGITINGTSLYDKLNEPEIIRFLSEALIRYKGIKKELLTETGDFSDTDFWQLVLINNVPEVAGYSRFLGKMLKIINGYRTYNSPDVRAVRKCIRSIKRVLRSGQEYAVGYYMDKKIPKSIRKMIAENPVNYYVYKTMRMAGFSNTDMIRQFIKNLSAGKAVDVLCWKESHRIPGQPEKTVPAFIKDMIAALGEKKTCRILSRCMEFGRIGIIDDAALMYAAIPPARREIKGKTIFEIHDNISDKYKMRLEENYIFDYTDSEKKLEDTICNISFYLPADSSELAAAAQKLHNCVNSYRGRIITKCSTIVLMKKDSSMVGCIELQGGDVVVQAYAPCNRCFKENENQIFNEWKTKHNLKGHANGWA
jgi:hypothetical protein